MQTETHTLKQTLGVAQPITFKFAPRFCRGVFAYGPTGLTVKFLVDPTVPGKTCNCWVWNSSSTNVQGDPLLNCLPNGNDNFVTSDCFG
jgi:hypothetical protein